MEPLATASSVSNNKKLQTWLLLALLPAMVAVVLLFPTSWKDQNARKMLLDHRSPSAFETGTGVLPMHGILSRKSRRQRHLRRSLLQKCGPAMISRK